MDKKEIKEKIYEGFGYVLFGIVLLTATLVLSSTVKATSLELTSYYAHCASSSQLVSTGLLGNGFAPVNSTLGQMEFSHLGQQLKECVVTISGKVV